MDKNNNTDDSLPGEGPLAAEAAQEGAATVLDYLWVDHAESAAEPAPQAREHEPDGQAGPCLESTLQRYGRWLGSLETD